jgi:hypothetical protein
MRQRLEWYDSYFVDEGHRIAYIIDNTDGAAREFLEPLYLNECSPQVAEDLIDAVVEFLSNPSERQQGYDDYLNLRMYANTDLFWEFYRRFRLLATTAEVSDDYTLRTNLRDKILPRLRLSVVHEWERCHDINKYTSAVQRADIDFHTQ